MWDVKVLDLEEGMAPYEFYLNYVGCKGITRRFARITELNCFTLTMWDVKSNFEAYYNDVLSMFYLNYVGCKDVNGMTVSESASSKFYLNYVGCKDHRYNRFDVHRRLVLP